MGRRTNKFSKAIRHIKSTEIDDKLAMLEAAPTNSTMGYMSTGVHGLPKPDITTNAFPTLPLPDFDQDDASENGQDTSGLFNPSGVHAEGTKILVEEPPGDTSYILGPMAAMYYTWSYPWTMIGYIRESDRKVVNLARIDGKLSDWDGVSGFRNDWWGGQLTLEQAVWFRDVKKYGNVGNDPANANYRAFYPGPPSNSPDAFGRYYCITTGEYKNRDVNTPVPGRTEPDPNPPSPDEILAAIMDRIRKRAKLSNKEKEWLWDNDLGYLLPPDQRTDPRDDPDYGSQSQSERLKDLFNDGKEKVDNWLDNIKDIAKSTWDYLKLAKSGVEAVPTSADALQQYLNNNDPNHPDYRKNDPRSDNYTGPYEPPTDQKWRNEVGQQIKNSLPKWSDWEQRANNSPDGKTELTNLEITTLSNNMKPITGNGDMRFHTFFNSLPVSGNEHSDDIPGDDAITTVTIDKDGNIDIVSNYRFTDRDDVSSGGPLMKMYVQSYMNKDKGDEGTFPFYDKDAQYDNRTQTGTTHDVNMRLRLNINGGNSSTWPARGTDVKNFKTNALRLMNSYTPEYGSAEVLSESRKSILKNIKKPVVLPKEPKKFKVKPKLRTPNKWMGSTPKISKPVDTPKEYKKIGGRNLWGKAEYNYNVTQSQERMNQVYELVGDGNMAFDYMLTDSKKLNDEQMEKFWGKNPDFYSYFYGGKKYKLVRKEQMDGDYLVFLVDDHGEKSNILQSELNEKLAEEQEKKELEEYNKMNPKQEPVSFEKDYMFKKAYQKLKPQVDYKGKPAKKGYPEDPPPEMVNNRHPDFGKMPGSTYYNKLDPQSAAAMPQQDDPLIDAKAKDAKENPKKDSAIFRRKLDDKMKKERERLNKEEWETSDWRKDLEGII